MATKERCSTEDVELVINFDGTLSLNSQMKDARSIALPLIRNLRNSVSGLKIDFSYFGDRTSRPHNFNRWILPDLTQSCHMPILPLTEDLDSAIDRLDRILKRFVPVSGGLDDPAEDSLGSLYKILSNFQARDYHRHQTNRWPLGPTHLERKETLRIILTVSDSKGHYAEDGTKTNQGSLEFPPISDLSEEPLVCDSRYTYVPLKLLATKLQLVETQDPYRTTHTHLVTYTDSAYTGWWFWLYDKLNVNDRSDVISGDFENLLSNIDDVICKFSESQKNTTPWPILPPIINTPLPVFSTRPAFLMTDFDTLRSIPWAGSLEANSMPSGVLRFLMVLIIACVFVCGCCATWCLNKTAYLKPDVVPTVSMAPADSVAASEYRDEMASVTSGQYA